MLNNGKEKKPFKKKKNVASRNIPEHTLLLKTKLIQTAWFVTVPWKEPTRWQN